MENHFETLKDVFFGNVNLDFLQVLWVEKLNLYAYNSERGLKIGMT